MATVSNLERMKTLDDAWNAQKWDVFRTLGGHDGLLAVAT
jgi:hypothetical protein